MKRLLYFASGSGNNAPRESYTVLADNIAGVTPIDDTSTAVFFHKHDWGIDDTNQKDKIVFTHDDTYASTGHRCKAIAEALALAANAGPHAGDIIDVVDLDNNIFFNKINFITALVVTLGISE